MVVEYLTMIFILGIANAAVCDPSYDKSYESIELNFEYTTNTSKKLSNLLASSTQDSYYGLASSITDASKNSILFSMDHSFNVRWNIYVGYEIIPDSFLISYDDANLYYIQIHSGCDIVRRPTSDGGLGFSK